jgi:hypothetical protein
VGGGGRGEGREGEREFCSQAQFSLNYHQSRNTVSETVEQRYYYYE